MRWLRDLLPSRRPAASSGRPPTMLVEFLADRGRLDEELAALRAETANATEANRQALSQLAERLAAARVGIRDDLARATGELRVDAASSERAVKEDVDAHVAALREDLERTQAAVADRLVGLTNEVGKASREQFRATNLLEGQGATLDELAQLWQEHLDQREREVDGFHQLLADLESRVRAGFVVDLLPVADALAESIRSARELQAGFGEEALPVATGLLGPLLSRLRRRVPPESPGHTGAYEAWLEGLLLVERRLLALLGREGVKPIPVVGELFDPQRHLAVAVERRSDLPEGTVVREELRGYTITTGKYGERVLRPAEVVVARDGQRQDERAETGAGRAELSRREQDSNVVDDGRGNEPRGH